MSDSVIKLGIVGVGKIVRDQHLPSIYSNDDFELIACASRNAGIDSIPSYGDILQMLESHPELQAVALCMPPQVRHGAALTALNNGLHVLLEKPPGATLSEVEQLADLAQEKNLSLFASWHSRHACAVDSARSLLAKSDIQSIKVRWKEDVKKWHPGQEWIWQAGGLGVFDPGINGLSILTHISPSELRVTNSHLSFPQNKATPIAARLEMQSLSGFDVEIDFDWRETDNEDWCVECQTGAGLIVLEQGGAVLKVEGQLKDVDPSGEYASIYQRFSRLIKNRQSDVDLAPLKLVADAFLLGERESVEAFYE